MLGIALVVGAVCLDLRRGRTSSRPIAGDLRAAKLVAEEEAFFGARIRALMVKLGEKDDYTEGHTRRVALRAVQLGEELGLPPSRLRGLAIGWLLHDIGKLTVPDGILKKPAKLSDEEFVVIRRHTLWSVELLGELGGFDTSVQRLVLDHHERLDGGGYPHRKPAVELGLDTRILRICDVYDALVTTRVYREAWPHEWAIALLRSETGAAFDERCVEALERVLRREGLLPEPAAVVRRKTGPFRPPRSRRASTSRSHGVHPVFTETSDPGDNPVDPVGNPVCWRRAGRARGPVQAVTPMARNFARLAARRSSGPRLSTSAMARRSVSPRLNAASSQLT